MAKTSKKTPRGVRVAGGKKKAKASSMSLVKSGYARMLVDPCGANLVEPFYGGTVGTMVRTTQNTLGGGTAYEAWAYHPFHGLYVLAAPDVATPSQFVKNATLVPPIPTNDGRAVAGCLSAQYIGPESGRQGMLMAGTFPAASLLRFTASGNGGDNASVTIGSLARALAHTERAPVDKFEINWVPGPGDGDYTTINSFSSGTATANHAIADKTNFVMMLLYNTGATSNYVLKSVAINELQFDTAVGTAYGINTRAVSVTPAHVVAELAAKDSSWYINTFKKIGGLIGGGVKSYVEGGLPGALGYLLSGTNKAINKMGSAF